jgi:hypothetical protein
MVVHDVTAGPQHGRAAVAQVRLVEGVGDQVEPLRTRRGDDGLAITERPRIPEAANGRNKAWP